MNCMSARLVNSSKTKTDEVIINVYLRYTQVISYMVQEDTCKWVVDKSKSEFRFIGQCFTTMKNIHP